MMFGEALALLKKGGIVTRTGWNGKNLTLRLITDTTMWLGWYIGIHCEGKLIAPWTASQTDLLSGDWDAVHP